jgi:ribonuclease HII
VLVDGNMLPPGLTCAAEAIVSGDALSVSIAAASIIAKVTRDRLMACVGRAFPDYGFEQHMGYSTPAHFEALDRHGPCEHHRRSFAPIRAALAPEPATEDLFATGNKESAVAPEAQSTPVALPNPDMRSPPPTL